MSTTTDDIQRTERTKEALLRLGRRVRLLRERSGLTQEELAARSGISVSFASLLERGERSPSYETLLGLSEALEVPLVMLFQEDTGLGEDEELRREEEVALSPLVSFGRAARLTAPQVERLLRVAQAMFEGHHLDAPVASKRPHCSEAGCERPVLARGLCGPHYHRARRLPTDPSGEREEPPA